MLAEGPRGSLTKDLVATKKLDNINPQSYGIGIKELWDIQPGAIAPGYVAHTLGWPVATDMYGGGWIYGLSNNRVSIGLVIGLNTPTRNSIRTKHFKSGRPTRTSKKFSTAGNSSATARNRSPLAAGIPCRAITWTAA